MDMRDRSKIMNSTSWAKSFRSDSGSATDVEKVPLNLSQSSQTSFRNNNSNLTKSHNTTTTTNTTVTKASLLLLAILLFFFFLWKESQRSQSTREWHMSDIGTEWRVAIVADLDRMSVDTSEGRLRWRSVLKFGRVSYNKESNEWSVSWSEEEEHELSTYLGEAGRGLELSELVYWQNRLLTFDDRSGVVFEVRASGDTRSSEQYVCVPRYILSEGDGLSSAKGQKTEWATVKQGKLYVGSFGKEFTDRDHNIVHQNNMWISILEKEGMIRHEDWTDKYNLLREATGTLFPGYMIHEAIHYNEYSKEWIVLPRRVSADPYDEKLDERKGSNLLIVVNDDFTKVKQVVNVGEIVPERGFSSFKFLPDARGNIIIALKTVEEEDKETGISKQNSFITIFDRAGTVLLPDSPIPGQYKYEGIEFV